MAPLKEYKGTMIRSLERMVDDALGLEPLREYVLVTGFGDVLKNTINRPSEIERLNEILRAFGSDRRWMQVEDIEDCQA